MYVHLPDDLTPVALAVRPVRGRTWWSYAGQFRAGWQGGQECGHVEQDAVIKGKIVLRKTKV